MSEGNKVVVHPVPATAGSETHPLLALLVESADRAEDLHALQCILMCESLIRDEELVQEILQKSSQPPSQGILVTRETKNNKVSTEVRSKAVKKSTPERIRARAARLYNEIHDLIDQYNIRKDREKFLSTGRRPSELQQQVVTQKSSTESTVDRMAAGLPARPPDSAPTKNALPDLFKSFQMARQRHLNAAEEERSKFPLQQRGAYSDKDPSSFSLRFQQPAS